MTVEQLENALIETAYGFLSVNYADTVERDCAVRLALDIYASVGDVHIKAVNAGLGEFVPDEPPPQVKRDGSN